MDMESILRIVGQIAGIGGLAIGLFLLVARSVLKELPKPKGFSQDRFKSIVDKIIIFAFILSIIGLGIYGFLKYMESANLVQENKKLQNTLSLIVEQNLKAKTAAIEVLDLDLTFDLTGWKSVPLENIRTDKKSLEITTNKRKLWKATREAKTMIGTYGTRSSFEPVFDCLEYDMLPIRNTDPLTPGVDTENRWILEYNLEKAPLFTPFEVTTVVRAYNSMQNEKTEFEGTLISFPTRKALLRVKFPMNKLPLEDPNSIWCETKPLGENIPFSRVQNPKINISEDRSIVEWEIDEPRLNYLYLIHWNW